MIRRQRSSNRTYILFPYTTLVRSFTRQPPETAETGTELRYRVTAEDAEGQAIFYGLLTAPEGMEIDSETGLLTWTPGPDASALTTVVVEALDTRGAIRSEEHTSELQSLMRISYAVFCLKK